jgi:MYXO-CTERM domain-containing protein
MLSFRRAIFCCVGAFAALALSTGIASASPIVDYRVTTAGCFNCTTAGSFTDIAFYGGYTFDGVTTSNGATDASGNATVSLGTLARNNTNYSQSPIGSDFMLQLNFLLPLGMGGGAEKLVATIVGTQGQPGDLDFDNAFKTYTFSNEFGTGSFEFRVNDIVDLRKNHSVNLTGDIRNAVFTPTKSQDATAVPEPAGLALFGVGLLAVARQFRRRKSK